MHLQVHLHLYKLLAKCPKKNHVVHAKNIPVLISNRRPNRRSRRPQRTALVRIKRAPIIRQAFDRDLPSILLSNARSLFNKFDEIELRINQYKPSIIVFIETWLSDEVPDAAIALEGFSTFRNDRNSRGGGIVCYLRDHFTATIFRVTTLSSCDSEHLCIYVQDFNLVVLAVYHPFWENSTADEALTTLIIHYVDSAFVQFGSDLRILLCGDFNGFRAHFANLSNLTGLLPVVDFFTRASNTIDQVFVNFATDVKASALPPFGRSDHRAVLWSPAPSRRTPPIKKRVRNFSKGNVAMFQYYLTSIDSVSYTHLTLPTILLV